MSSSPETRTAETHPIEAGCTALASKPFRHPLVEAEPEPLQLQAAEDLGRSDLHRVVPQLRQVRGRLVEPADSGAWVDARPHGAHRGRRLHGEDVVAGRGEPRGIPASAGADV